MTTVQAQNSSISLDKQTRVLLAASIIYLKNLSNLSGAVDKALNLDQKIEEALRESSSTS